MPQNGSSHNNSPLVPDVPVPSQFVPPIASAGNGKQPLSAQRPLNRVAVVREQQGVSERTIARRLGIEVKRYRELEKPGYDLRLSELSALQVALDVPLSDLLEDRQALSRPVEERAKLVRVMKSAVALREMKSNVRVQRMAKMLCEQLVDLMPELAEVGGWPQFGARRGQAAMSKALSHPVDTSQLDSVD